jgi:hypothetical protein
MGAETVTDKPEARESFMRWDDGSPVRIARVRFDWIVYSYVTYSSVGCFPGTDSTEWIEYIPEPAIVERDGDLWWRCYAPEIDAMRYIQMTKGSDARRT